MSSDSWVRSVHEGARYTNIHIKHNILISGKLQYLKPLSTENNFYSKQILEKITTTFSNPLLDVDDWSALCPGNLKCLYSLDRRWVDSMGG